MLVAMAALLQSASAFSMSAEQSYRTLNTRLSALQMSKKIVPLHTYTADRADGGSAAPGLRVFGLSKAQRMHAFGLMADDAGQDLKSGALVTLSARSAAVVRKRGVHSGAGFRLGNNDDGEWYAVVVQGGISQRKGVSTGGDETEQDGCIVRIEAPLRPPQQVPVVSASVLYAPPKSQARHRFLLEKATEIGAVVLQPVETARTHPSGLRACQSPAALSWCLAAVEQSDRMRVPDLRSPLLLAQACQEAVLAGKSVYLCSEPRSGGGRHFLTALIEDHQRLSLAPVPPTHGSLALIASFCVCVSTFLFSDCACTCTPKGRWP